MKGPSAKKLADQGRELAKEADRLGLSYDPLLDVARQVADHNREVTDLTGRVDGISQTLRKDQAEMIRERGLPADLVSVETNVWRRLSPARNRWPEIAAFDERVAELEMRQAAKADELRELRDREIAAPAADADRLATWQLDEEKGPRPEPELPAIREEIQRRKEEWEALTRATARVLADKTAFVEKHRGRLVKEADSYADEARRRYLELIDQLADARADLAAKRSAAVWARLYPGELAGRGPADTFAGGRRVPLQAMGLSANVEPGRVLDGLRADAEWLYQAATPEQRFAIEGRDPRTPPDTVWDRSDEGQQWQRDQRQRALHRLRNPQ
jgi:hypothetical protein